MARIVAQHRLHRRRDRIDRQRVAIQRRIAAHLAYRRDVAGHDRQRYWDGATWTSLSRQVPAAAERSSLWRVLNRPDPGPAGVRRRQRALAALLGLSVLVIAAAVLVAVWAGRGSADVALF